MPCTITNRLKGNLFVPVAGVTLRSGEKRTLDYIERDALMNDTRVMDLVRKGHLAIKGPYDSQWNTKEPFRMEPFQLWMDSNCQMRMKEGAPPLSDTDGDLVGGEGASTALELVQDQPVNIGSRTFAQTRASFWGWWPDQTMATWGTYWKYCLWSFNAVDWSAPTRVWTEPQRFTTEDELFSFMEANLPTSGGAYTYPVIVRLYDEVDAEDTYPDKLVFRNSLVASMAGRRRWSRKGTEYYGVDSAFNAPSYYTNFYGQLGQRFVATATGFTPPTNNDNCVWYQRWTKGMWHWPANGVEIVSLGTRGAVWDTTTTSWVSPAPVGWYSLQTPFLLHEYKKNRVLGIKTDTGPDLRMYETNAVSAWVFPVVSAGRYYGFLVCPHGADSWSTSWHDTAEYKVCLKLRYPGNYRHRYVEIEPTPTVWSNSERLIWSIFDSTGTGSHIVKKQPSGYESDIDNNTVPLKVYISRRNIATNKRSRWVPLLDVRRRLNRASFRVQPSV